MRENGRKACQLAHQNHDLFTSVRTCELFGCQSFLDRDRAKDTSHKWLLSYEGFMSFRENHIGLFFFYDVAQNSLRDDNDRKRHPRRYKNFDRTEI